MNKRKTWTFATNLGKKFGRNFVIFEKILLVWRFCWFFFSISALVWLSVQSKKVLTQKLLYLNKCPGLLISNLRYLQNWENGSVLEVVLTSFRSTINHVSNKYNTTGFIFAQYTWTIYGIPSHNCIFKSVFGIFKRFSSKLWVSKKQIFLYHENIKRIIFCHRHGHGKWYKQIFDEAWIFYYLDFCYERYIQESNSWRVTCK